MIGKRLWPGARLLQMTPEQIAKLRDSVDEARLAHPRPDDARRWERHLARVRARLAKEDAHDGA